MSRDLMATGSSVVARLGASRRGLLESLPAPTGRLWSLGKGDPSFDTPEFILEAASDAMRTGVTHYPPILGDPLLREVVAEYQATVVGSPYSAENVLISVGATQALTIAMMALLDPGDEIIVLDPSYSIYADLARALDLGVVVAPVLASPRETFVQAGRQATDRTKAIIVNYPANPTGHVLDDDDVDVLAEIASSRGWYVFSDEVYDQIVFDGIHRSPASHPDLTSRTVVINAVSKTYAMTGWRVGWIAAPRPLIEPMAAVLRGCFGMGNSIAMRAAVAALTDSTAAAQWRAEMMAEYRDRRQVLGDELRRIPGLTFDEPGGAFYHWVEYEADLPSAELVARLYARGLAVRPGSEFGLGGERHLRITFAADIATIRGGMEILRSEMELLASH